MSTNQLAGVVIRDAQILLGGAPTAQYEWAEGKRSEVKRLDVNGLPIWRYSVTVLAGTDQLPGSLEVSSRDEPASLPGGLVPIPPSATLIVRGPRKGEYGLSITVSLPAEALRAFSGSPSPKVS